MTIKTKLTLNVVSVLVIVGAVVTTGVVGLTFIKGKLFYLTERSTPFQMRTMEFQRAVQGATSDLVKVGISANGTEYQAHRKAAETSLVEVKKTQEALELLSNEQKTEAHQQLSAVGQELFSVTEERLKAEEGAIGSSQTLAEKLKDSAKRLAELDQRIRGFQSNRSTTYTKSLEDTKNINANLRSIESLRMSIKDLQLALTEVQDASDKKGLAIARGKARTAMSKTTQNNYATKNGRLGKDIGELEQKMNDLLNAKANALDANTGAEVKSKYESTKRDVQDKSNSLLLVVEQEIASASEKYTSEAENQGKIFDNANRATAVLVGTSELAKLGLNLEGLGTRLSTARSSQDIDTLESELKSLLQRFESQQKLVDKTLDELKAKDERAMLRNAVAGIGSVKELLFSSDGIISKVRNELAMKDKATKATEKLRDIVMAQADTANKTLSVAQTGQEKSIVEVNRVVLMNITLTIVIGIIAVLFGIGFGIWVYRSISKPLGTLVSRTNKIAEGDFTHESVIAGKDEFGIVETAMDRMTENLRNMVEKIRSATDKLAESSQELSSTAGSLDKGSAEQGSQIEQSAGAMTQMSQTTEDVTRNVSDTSETAQTMRDIALKGKDVVHSSTLELGKFVDVVKESASKVEALGNKSYEINNIVDLIKEIADQTNLLALNAAIEAARAGDHGRGFAIVAENVRQLAERTTLAANDIAAMIGSMRSEIELSVDSMKSQRDSVETLTVQANETLRSIDEIVDYVGQVTDMVSRIAVAMEQQSATSIEVSQNMESISSVTRQLRDSSTGMKLTAEGLSTLANELNNTMAWFRL